MREVTIGIRLLQTVPSILLHSLSMILLLFALMKPVSMLRAALRRGPWARELSEGDLRPTGGKEIKAFSPTAHEELNPANDHGRELGSGSFPSGALS